MKIQIKYYYEIYHYFRTQKITMLKREWSIKYSLLNWTRGKMYGKNQQKKNKFSVRNDNNWVVVQQLEKLAKHEKEITWNSFGLFRKEIDILRGSQTEFVSISMAIRGTIDNVLKFYYFEFGQGTLFSTWYPYHAHTHTHSETCWAYGRMWILLGGQSTFIRRTKHAIRCSRAHLANLIKTYYLIWFLAHTPLFDSIPAHSNLPNCIFLFFFNRFHPLVNNYEREHTACCLPLEEISHSIRHTMPLNAVPSISPVYSQALSNGIIKQLEYLSQIHNVQHSSACVCVQKWVEKERKNREKK